MRKILTALVAGTFAVGLYAAGPDFSTFQADSIKQKALNDWQSMLPDSIKAKIEEHQKAISTFNADFEVAKVDYKAKIDSEKVVWQTKLDGVLKGIPDSLKPLLDKVQLPDSIKAKVEAYKALNQARIDSLKVIVEKRKADAKINIETALAKLDSEKRAKYEKALAEIDKKLAERQAKAEEAQKKYAERKAVIEAKITKEIDTKK